MSGLETALIAAGSLASAAGTAIGAVSSIEQGKEAERAAQVQARALERQAREKEAAASREAISRNRQAEIALSRQQAVAAGSGAGATDPTVLDIMGDTVAAGAYNRASAIYEGQASARGLDEQAELARYRGAQMRRAGEIGAVSTILSGMSSFAQTAAGSKGRRGLFSGWGQS